MDKKIVSFILAGGSGTRLAPLSLSFEGKLPKQFLPLLAKKTIFQQTIDRLPPEVDKKVVVSVKKYKETIEKQGEGRVEVIAEPFPCNTAIAIGLAAIYARKKMGDENTVIFFNTADHYMIDDLFRKYYWTMIGAAEDGKIVLMGITPDRPETGLGYIKIKEPVDSEKQIYKIERFVEKPVLEKAIEFVESGNYLWNSGMFCFTAKTILDKLEKHSPLIYSSLMEIDKFLGTDKEDEIIEKEYQKIKDAKANISIDFAVMEHESEDILLVKAEKDLKWDDIGLWVALKKYFPEDDNGNIVKDNVALEKCQNMLVLNYVDNQKITVSDLEDLLIVNTPNGLLICPQASSIRASEIVPELEKGEKEILIDSSGINIMNKIQMPAACIGCKDLTIELENDNLAIKKTP